MAAKTERLAGRLSRREFTRIGCSVLASLFGRTAFAFYSRPAALNVQLAHEFPKTRNMALAPDGKKICLEDWNSRDYPFRVVEIGTGQTLYSGGLGTRASAQFFADSETLLLETGGRPGERKHPQTVLNIATGERSERYVPLAPEFRSYESFFPLERGIVLIKHTEQKPLYETTSLAIVQYADNHEITKAPFATEVRGPKLRSSSGFEEPGESTYCFCLSDDRKALAYAFDDVVVCRRLPSLEVTWAKHGEKGLRPYYMAISATGEYVAVAFVDTEYLLSNDSFKRPHRYHIALHSGKTGSEEARLPLDGRESIAISPKGDLLAVVVPEFAKNEAVPTVHLYEPTSGNKLASITHDHIRNATFTTSGCKPEFTSDGKYLITSGMVTKVWSIDQ